MIRNNENQLHIVYLSIYLVSYRINMTAKKALVKGPGWDLGTTPAFFLLHSYLRQLLKERPLGQPRLQMENDQSSCLPSSLPAPTVWTLKQGMDI